MTLTQLRYLCALAKTGSYTVAAEECGVSESVVHRAVASLGKACGIRLFERTPAGIRLTAAGTAIHEYATQISSLVDLADHALLREKGLLSGSLAIGAGTAALLHLLPEVLAPWLVEHPHVRVSISEGRTSSLEQLMLNGRLDLMFAYGNKWSEQLQRQQIFVDSLVVVSTPEHRFARYKAVSLRELSQERLILMQKGTLARLETEQIEAQYGVQFTSAVEVERFETARTLCRAGAGLAIIPRTTVSEDIDNKQMCVLNVESFPRSRPYFVLYRGGAILTPEISSFLAVVQRWALERSSRILPV
ncbi:MAG: LysR family transcriptional regulator [Chloroflexi bacterium]|nr:LysR family transcriptional regulator [Chloroflexota bacterium]